jgi:hypothetical protein
MKTAIVLTLIAAAGVARADETFESRAANAQRVHRVENLVWALTAPCDQGDDTEQRQCRIVRDRRAAELSGQTLILDADRDAFAVGAYNAQKKSAQLALAACIRCAGVEVEGKTWYVVGNGAAKVDAGKVHAGSLGDVSRSFPDEAAAKAFAAKVAGARVQLVVKVPAKAKWAEGGKQGVSLDVVAWRVVLPCDGSIVAANPPSQPIEADKQQCAPIASAKPADDAPKLEALTTSAIKDALRPVVLAADKCFNQFGVAGTARLKLTVNGDGTIAKYEQQGDFAGTPTGECIDKSIDKAAFPRTKKPQTSFLYPITLK